MRYVNENQNGHVQVLLKNGLKEGCGFENEETSADRRKCQL
jgi:hypothetical protein